MRVFIINDYREAIGGVEAYLSDFLPMLKGKEIVVSEFYIDEYLDYQPLGVLEQLKYKIIVNKGLKERLTGAIQAFSPDLIHIHNNQLLPATLWAVLSVVDIPVLQSIHDLYQLNIDYTNNKIWYSGIKRELYKYLRKRQVAAVDHFLVHSDYMRTKVIEHVPITSVSNIPLMVKGIAMGNKSFIHREKIILFSGRLTEEKGIAFLIESFNQADFLDEYTLVIMGRGLLEEKVIAATEENARIKYEGFVKDIGAWYKRAAILVVPSTWEEPFGLVGIEGFAQGAAVVASDVGGIPEWCIHDQTGLLFQAGVVKDFLWKLKDCIQDVPATQKRIINAYQLLQANYSPQLHIMRMIALYRRIQKAS